jgi:ribosomal 50S subunit-recycling heat shock protein
MGRVLVNGNVAKPAKQIKIGDIIEIEYANKTEKYEVLTVPNGNVSIQEAENLYKHCI